MIELNSIDESKKQESGYQTKLWFYDLQEVLMKEDPIVKLQHYFAEESSNEFISYLLDTYHQAGNAAFKLNKEVSLKVTMNSNDFELQVGESLYMYDSEKNMLFLIDEDEGEEYDVKKIVDDDLIKRILSDCNVMANVLDDCYNKYKNSTTGVGSN